MERNEEKLFKIINKIDNFNLDEDKIDQSVRKEIRKSEDEQKERIKIDQIQKLEDKGRIYYKQILSKSPNGIEVVKR